MNDVLVARLLSVVIGSLWLWVAVNPTTPVAEVWGEVLLRAFVAFSGSSMILMGVFAHRRMR